MKRPWWATARGQLRARWRAALAIGFMPRLLGGLLLLNVLMMGLAAWSLHDSRLKYQEGAVIQTQNLARMLDHDFTGFLRSVDLTLQASSTDLERLLGGRRRAPRLSMLTWHVSCSRTRTWMACVWPMPRATCVTAPGSTRPPR